MHKRKYDDSGLQESIINLVSGILHDPAKIKVGSVLYNAIKCGCQCLHDQKVKNETGSSLSDAKRWFEAQTDENN